MQDLLMANYILVTFQKKNIENAKKFTSYLKDYINFYIDDSVHFLKYLMKKLTFYI